MTAAARAREVIAGFSPQAAETHRVSILMVELLAEVSEQNARVIELLEQGAGGGTTVNNTSTTSRAGTPRGAGPAARPAPASTSPALGGAQADQQSGDADVQIKEVDVPPAGDDDGGRPAPAKKAAAKKAAATQKTTSAAAAAPGKE